MTIVTLLSLAREAAQLGEVPIAAAIVHSETGAVVAESANRVERDADPTAHAEMVVIREAIKILSKNSSCADSSIGQRQTNKYLSDYDLYVTLEPCAMCAQAIAHARIRKVVFGAYDPKSGGVEHGARVFSHSQCHHTPEVIGGVMEGECSALLKEFFEARR